MKLDDKQKANVNAAIMFHSKAQTPAEDAFWAGYIRGLRYNYRGKFGTQQEHEFWLRAADEHSDMFHQMRSMGYRLGFNGESAELAAGAIRTVLEAMKQ